MRWNIPMRRMPGIWPAALPRRSTVLVHNVVRVGMGVHKMCGTIFQAGTKHGGRPHPINGKAASYRKDWLVVPAFLYFLSGCSYTILLSSKYSWCFYTCTRLNIEHVSSRAVLGYAGPNHCIRWYVLWWAPLHRCTERKKPLILMMIRLRSNT